MDWQLILQYAWIIVVLVGLEGLLSADNALVLAVMVKHLPRTEQKKALFYGLLGAFVFRFIALFLISFLINVWQVQALGALYLIGMSARHLYMTYKARKMDPKQDLAAEAKEETAITEKPVTKKEFWWTVAKVEFADIAFAVDSILAAVALAVSLPPLGLGEIGGIDSGQFFVVLTGGLIGVILMRFAARIFVKLLHQRPTLETAAFIIVGWVGVKLTVLVLEHPGFKELIAGTPFAFMGLPDGFVHSTAWTVFFWSVMVGIAVWGWFSSKPTAAAKH